VYAWNTRRISTMPIQVKEVKNTLVS